MLKLLEPLLVLVVGFLIFLGNRFLHYFVVVYLIAAGILWLMHHNFTQLIPLISVSHY
jgi:hypothetical protein